VQGGTIMGGTDAAVAAVAAVAAGAARAARRNARNNARNNKLKTIDDFKAVFEVAAAIVSKVYRAKSLTSAAVNIAEIRGEINGVDLVGKTPEQFKNAIKNDVGNIIIKYFSKVLIGDEKDFIKLFNENKVFDPAQPFLTNDGFYFDPPVNVPNIARPAAGGQPVDTTSIQHKRFQATEKLIEYKTVELNYFINFMNKNRNNLIGMSRGELINTYKQYILLRRKLYRQYGDKVIEDIWLQEIRSKIRSDPTLNDVSPVHIAFIKFQITANQSIDQIIRFLQRNINNFKPDTLREIYNLILNDLADENDFIRRHIEIGLTTEEAREAVRIVNAAVDQGAKRTAWLNYLKLANEGRRVLRLADDVRGRLKIVLTKVLKVRPLKSQGFGYHGDNFITRIFNAFKSRSFSNKNIFIPPAIINKFFAKYNTFKDLVNNNLMKINDLGGDINLSPYNRNFSNVASPEKNFLSAIVTRFYNFRGGYDVDINRFNELLGNEIANRDVSDSRRDQLFIIQQRFNTLNQGIDFRVFEDSDKYYYKGDVVSYNFANPGNLVNQARIKLADTLYFNRPSRMEADTIPSQLNYLQHLINRNYKNFAYFESFEKLKRIYAGEVAEDTNYTDLVTELNIVLAELLPYQQYLADLMADVNQGENIFLAGQTKNKLESQITEISRLKNQLYQKIPIGDRNPDLMKVPAIVPIKYQKISPPVVPGAVVPKVVKSNVPVVNPVVKPVNKKYDDNVNKAFGRLKVLNIANIDTSTRAKIEQKLKQYSSDLKKINKKLKPNDLKLIKEKFTLGKVEEMITKIKRSGNVGGDVKKNLAIFLNDLKLTTNISHRVDRIDIGGNNLIRWGGQRGVIIT
jgi:hypothetical protein